MVLQLESLFTLNADPLIKLVLTPYRKETAIVYIWCNTYDLQGETEKEIWLPSGSVFCYT